MNTGELLNHLRGRVVSMGLMPPPEFVLLFHLNNAYHAFVAALGGVPDELEVEVDANSNEVELPAYVLKIKSAQRADHVFVNVISRADSRINQFDSKADIPGEIEMLMVGAQPNQGRVACRPTVTTPLFLDVDRLPMTNLQKETDVPVDVSPLWQASLLDGALSQLMKTDANPDIRMQSAGFEAVFRDACTTARREKERAKSKAARVIAYGGL